MLGIVVRRVPQKTDTENFEEGLMKDQEKNKAQTSSLLMMVLSCCMYAVCSIAMVMANKAISTSLPTGYGDKLPRYGVILYQNIIAVILVYGAKLLKIVEYPSFSMTTAIAWIPLNILFVGMICSGFLSLVYVNVPMVTITKNLSNLLTVAGECIFFGESISALVIISVLVMAVGSIMAGLNDLEFSVIGYFWMAVNCVFTSGYTLYMRYASTNIKLTKFGMVFYNNFLSIFLVLPLVIWSGELNVLQDPVIISPLFLTLNTIAGFLGFYLNFASLWCVAATSATTFCIVGALNKVPILIIGFVWFNAKMTSQGVMFVVIATIGGFLYAYAKLPKSK